MTTATRRGTPTHPTVALTAICLGFAMITLDATIVNVALPAIGRDIGGSLANLQWVVDSYTVVLAAMLLSSGAAADRLGARRMFLIGLGVFTLTSAGCALAGNATALVVMRALQGVGAAWLLPASLSLIRQQFPDPRRRAHALGVWGGLSSIGLAAGPVLGGVAVGWLGWQAIFVVNVPVGLAAIAMTLRTIGASRPGPKHHLDLFGQVLGIMTLGALAAGLISIRWLIVVGVLAAVGFVLVESRVDSPVLPLAVFGEHTFSAAVAIGLLFNFCLYGTLFCLSLYLQGQLRLGGQWAGLALLPLCATVGVNAFTSGRLIARFGLRPPMLAGALAGAAGSVLLAVLAGAGLGWLLVASVVFGCCSLTMPAMTAAAMNALPEEQAGLASGTLNAARQTGGALGVALLGSLFAIGLPLVCTIVAACYLMAAALAVVATRTGDRKT